VKRPSTAAGRRITPPEDIVEAARVMLRNGPADAFSVRELARTMELVPGTIYARFGTRDELLARVYIEWLREVIVDLEAFDVDSIGMADAVEQLAPLVGDLDGRFQHKPLPRENLNPDTWRELTFLFREQAHVLYRKLQAAAKGQGISLTNGSLAEHLAWTMIAAAQRSRTAEAFGHTQQQFARFVAGALATTLAVKDG
jgi:AcrR family transcriptional regulator